MTGVRNIILCYCVAVLVAWLGVSTSSAQGSKEIIGGNCSAVNCTNNIGAFCNDNQTCVCRDKHVSNSNKTACLPIQSHIGDPCQETVQCKANNSMCGRNKICTLIVDTVGEKCFANTTCVLTDSGDKHVSCKDGKCTCDSGYEPKEDKKSCVKTNTGTLPMLSLSTVVFVLVAKMLS